MCSSPDGAKAKNIEPTCEAFARKNKILGESMTVRKQIEENLEIRIAGVAVAVWTVAL